MVAPKQQIQNLKLAHNRLVGSIPDVIALIARGACVDFSFDLAFNQLAGTLPELLLSASSLARFEVWFNSFTGSLPDATCLPSRLQLFNVMRNSLVGSIPDARGFIARGGAMDLELGLDLNQFQGTLPEGIWSVSRLAVLRALWNLFEGSLPDAVEMPSRLATLHISMNKLTGNMPDGLRYCSGSMSQLNLYWNCFEGLLPQSLGMLTSIERLDISCNHWAGHIPDALGLLQSMNNLALSLTKLSGPLPEVWFFKELMATNLKWVRGTLPSGVMLGTATKIFLSDDNLVGTIPESLYSCSLLEVLTLENNRGLLGSLPDRVALLRKLCILAISSTALSGTLPSSIGNLLSMAALRSVDTLLEGSIPPSLARIPELESLEIGRSDRAIAFEGRIPGGLARAQRLSLVAAQRNRLEGRIPKFTSTLRLLVVHENRLRRASDMHFNNAGAVLMLFGNRLSCQLPSCPGQNVSKSVVALGNHFAAPQEDDFPAWVMSFERDKFFWVENNQGLVIFMRVVAGCVLLIASVKGQLGLHRCWNIILRWECVRTWGYRELVAITSSLLALLGLQFLWSCLERLLFLEHGFYDCPGFLAYVSSCLSQEPTTQSVVVLVWSRFFSYASRPLWLQRAGMFQRALRRARIRRYLVWACWLLVVLMVSELAVLNVMTHCIPGFLRGKGQSTTWAAVLNVCFGACQGLASSILIPALAGKVTQLDRSKYALVSVATLVVTCLSPAASVLYLDGACLGHWVYWWKQCLDDPNAFHYALPCLRGQKGVGGEMVCTLVAKTNQELLVLKHRDICEPDSQHLSVSKCARALALQLQSLLLAKLIASGLPFAAGRLLAGLHYRSTAAVFLKLSLMLEMGSLVAAPLPLIIPFLVVSILGDKILASVAWHQSLMRASSLQGIVRTSILITGFCSFFFHAAIVCESSKATVLLLLLAAMRRLAAHQRPW